ncbi:uncharacterized protein FN964_015618 isoform 1-T1 [Alca torda]
MIYVVNEKQEQKNVINICYLKLQGRLRKRRTVWFSSVDKVLPEKTSFLCLRRLEMFSCRLRVLLLKVKESKWLPVMLRIEAAMAGGSVSFTGEHAAAGICCSVFIPSTPRLSSRNNVKLFKSFWQDQFLGLFEGGESMPGVSTGAPLNWIGRS